MSGIRSQATKVTNVLTKASRPLGHPAWCCKINGMDDGSRFNVKVIKIQETIATFYRNVNKMTGVELEPTPPK